MNHHLFKDKNTNIYNYMGYEIGKSLSRLATKKIPNISVVTTEKKIQIDEFLPMYLENKKECMLRRDEHVINNLSHKQNEMTLKHFENIIKLENIKVSGSFNDLEELINHIPEDICLLDMDQDSKTVFLHLCAPKDWYAKWAIGKTFDQIHESISYMPQVLKSPAPLLHKIIQNEMTLERIGAVNLTTSSLLNHAGYLPFEQREPQLTNTFYLRFERQILLPIPETSLIAFLIKTYVTDFMHFFTKDDLRELIESPGFRYGLFVERNKKQLIDLLESA